MRIKKERTAKYFGLGRPPPKVKQFIEYFGRRRYYGDIIFFGTRRSAIDLATRDGHTRRAIDASNGTFELPGLQER